MSTGLQVDDRRLRAALAQIMAGLPINVAKALNTVAVKIRDDAKANCPVDTGALMKSISRETVRREGHVYRVAVTAGGRVVNPKTGRLVDYAAIVHEGTSRMPGRPFMLQALLNSLEEIRRILSETILRGII